LASKVEMTLVIKTSSWFLLIAIFFVF
jgi:hypothetical protein